MDALSHSHAGPHSGALQPLPDPFSFHGAPVVHAHSQRLLSVSTLLCNFSFHECHQVSRTSSRHVWAAQHGVSANCSAIPPYPGRQWRCWAPCEHRALPGLRYPTAPMSRFIQAALAGVSHSLLLCSVDTPHRYRGCFSVLIPTCHPLPFHPKMGVERSLRRHSFWSEIDTQRKPQIPKGTNELYVDVFCGL